MAQLRLLGAFGRAVGLGAEAQQAVAGAGWVVHQADAAPVRAGHAGVAGGRAQAPLAFGLQGVEAGVAEVVKKQGRGCQGTGAGQQHRQGQGPGQHGGAHQGFSAALAGSTVSAVSATKRVSAGSSGAALGQRRKKYTTSTGRPQAMVQAKKCW